MAGGVSRYRQAYNAGNTGRGLPNGLAHMADSDPLIDSAHDAGRQGVSFDEWQHDNGLAQQSAAPSPSPAPAKSPLPRQSGPRPKAPAKRSAPRARPASTGIRRRARAASVVNPTGGALPVGLTAGTGVAGLFFGAIAYALILSVVDYGPAGPGLWFKAKFLNQAAGSSSSSSSSSSVNKNSAGGIVQEGMAGATA